MFCNPTLFLPIFHRMQSFFVASTHFSVQNRRMHEEKTEKTETKMGLLKKIGVVNLVFITLFVGALLLSAAAVAYMYRNIPTHNNGEHMKELPWKGEDVIIREAEFGWADVSDNDWMVMNGIKHTPFVSLNIEGTTGSGTLYIRFLNSDGYYTGPATTVQYKDGTFETIDRRYYHASGTQATAYAYPVFTGTNIISANDQFIQHFNDERSKHWQAEISYLPANSDSKRPIPLGYSTIQKKLYKTDNK